MSWFDALDERPDPTTPAESLWWWDSPDALDTFMVSVGVFLLFIGAFMWMWAGWLGGASLLLWAMARRWLAAYTSPTNTLDDSGFVE